MINNDDDNDNIFKALNPSISELHEAQSAVHVQIKSSKQRNQRHQERAGDGRVKGQGPGIKYTTDYTLHNSFSQSVSLFSLSLSLRVSTHYSLSLSLSLTLTDQQYRQQQSLERNTNKVKVFQGISVPLSLLVFR